VAAALAQVDQLVAGAKLGRGLGNLLARELTIAGGALAGGHHLVGVTALRLVLLELDLLARLGMPSAADALPLRTLIERLI